MSRRVLVSILAIFMSLSSFNPAQAEDAPAPIVESVININSEPGLTVNPVNTEIPVGSKFSISGIIDPVKKNVLIKRQVKKGEKWSTIGSTKTKTDGTWSMSITAPVKASKATYRIVVGEKSIAKSESFELNFKKPSLNVVTENVAVNPASPIGFVGTISPAKAKIGVQLQVYDKKKKTWVKKASSKTAGDGSFNFTINASRTTAKYKYRVITTSGLSVAAKTSEQIVSVIPRIEALGPNGKILGVDISRYQGNVNFAKMFAAGARFVYIKSSDGGPNAHGRAVPYADQWIPQAKAAGLLVGQYHFAQIPNTDDMNIVVQAANDQADLIISRWNAHGGYSPGTLPLVLDIEQAGVPRNVSDAEAVTFVQTWLNKVQNATGKPPIVYSNPTFLKNHLSLDAALSNYQLWAANYFPVSNPGLSPKVGCINTIWTKSGCNLNWSFWQYSQTGPGKTFGVSSKAIDLNIFAGSAEDLLSLAGYPTP